MSLLGKKGGEKRGIDGFAEVLGTKQRERGEQQQREVKINKSTKRLILLLFKGKTYYNYIHQKESKRRV